MRIYEAMRLRLPDFFIHSGDTIYADGPVSQALTSENGRIWRNITTEAKSKVAETLADYRGAYRYNLMDDNVRRFNAEVPQIWNAGSFGPNPLDGTFAPEVVFQKAPPAQNTSPFAGYQFFGEVQIEGHSGEMTVQLRDLDGVVVFEQRLQPV
jgi:phosphodiesterase/alkaline phosphatase D-like protein